ncbi:hypothetical protein NEUTE2DRAFT_59704 [Neurospora tetrasperma FGSC 2509]|nr:hypothetical protein NEUTE2DRAFT_59704 [Neurospora tetrasperma FGSC 2509]
MDMDLDTLEYRLDKAFGKGPRGLFDAKKPDSPIPLPPSYSRPVSTPSRDNLQLEEAGQQQQHQAEISGHLATTIRYLIRTALLDGFIPPLRHKNKEVRHT